MPILTDFNILTIGKTNKQLPLAQLFLLTLRYVYNRDGKMDWISLPDRPMTREEMSDIMNSVVNWQRYINIQKAKLAEKFGNDYIYNDSRAVGTKGTNLDEQEFMISWIGWLLYESEGEGKVANHRKDIITHKLDYKKMYGIKAAFKEKDFIIAREHLKKAMAQHPEDYLDEHGQPLPSPFTKG